MPNTMREVLRHSPLRVTTKTVFCIHCKALEDYIKTRTKFTDFDLRRDLDWKSNPDMVQGHILLRADQTRLARNPMMRSLLEVAWLTGDRSVPMLWFNSVSPILDKLATLGHIPSGNYLVDMDVFGSGLPKEKSDG